MNLEIFLIGLMVVSTLTGLVTEAVKKILAEFNVTYFANTLAGIIATILSAAIGAGYVIFSGIGFDARIIICIIALAFMSWLSSMVGYDKVVQILTQIKTNRKG